MNAASTNAASPVLVDVALTVNGKRCRLTVDTRSSLLDTLREQLDLTGSKKGCDHGQCGACTVLLEGRRVKSCLVLTVACEDRDVVTVEGLSRDGELHPVQQAFLDADAYQCGYCTPGQICSAVGVLREAEAGWPSSVTGADVASAPAGPGGDHEAGAAPIVLDAAEIRERMSGNLCRCGAYVNIVAAIETVAR
jgi:xanthine dehydrogenase YagT iron-sulfur-binding subunit